MYLLLLALACASHHGAPPRSESPVSDSAAAGVQHPALRALLIDHWEDAMRRYPLWATAVGDHRYDDRLGDSGPASVEAGTRARDAFIARGRALSGAALGEADRRTWSLFMEMLETNAATDICHSEQWGLSARTTPVVDLNGLAESMPVVTVADGKNYTARLRGAGGYVDGVIANLRAGITAGRTPARGLVEPVLRQLDEQLAQDDAEWVLARPGLEAHAGWTADEEEAFRVELRAAIGGVRRAYEHFAGFVADELLPASRPEARAGALYLPDGEACYAALIRSETSLPKLPAEVHATGLAALEGIHAEMVVLGEKLFGTRDLPTILGRLRGDPGLRFTTGAEIQARAEDALARANAAVPRFFGRIPEATCTVKPIPDYEAPYTYIAYYNPAVPGERGGEYRINLSSPETRSRYEMEALSWHEAVPGHHFQIAIAQELPALPAFRRHLGTTAYVEGWALYTERLADEMGLYSGDLDRMGMLSFDAWRASRLVVDTGIHAYGWDRERAVQFMLANTALAENNIRNEVDRYTSWPGQATAYKIGQIEMWALRHEAERRLGKRFDIKGFHDVVLSEGAVTLPVLRELVEAWIVAKGG